VPYCTGDGHAGQVYKADPFYFDGHLNVEKILEHLKLTKTIADMDSMLVQGHSAGGIGVFRNCDFIGEWVRNSIGNHIEVKCNPMAGWYVAGFTDDQEDRSLGPKQYETWVEGLDAPMPDSDPKASQDPYYPERCVASLPKGMHKWSCATATMIYPSMRQPVFVMQDMFDGNQLHGGGAMHRSQNPTCQGQAYIGYQGRAMKNTTTNMVPRKPNDGLFLVSCYAHGPSPIAKIGDFNRMAALNSWWKQDGVAPRILFDECNEEQGWLPCGDCGECTEQECPYIPAADC